MQDLLSWVIMILISCLCLQIYELEEKKAKAERKLREAAAFGEHKSSDDVRPAVHCAPLLTLALAVFAARPVARCHRSHDHVSRSEGRHHR